MAGGNDFRARGSVVDVREGGIVAFRPSGGNYELHLVAAGGRYEGPVGVAVEGIIRAKARKVWTVPSGGGFITPLIGVPKIVQGRIRYLDEQSAVVQAGTFITIDLPKEDAAYDLAEGALEVGKLVNITLWPGCAFELILRSR